MVANDNAGRSCPVQFHVGRIDILMSNRMTSTLIFRIVIGWILIASAYYRICAMQQASNSIISFEWKRFVKMTIKRLIVRYDICWCSMNIESVASNDQD